MKTTRILILACCFFLAGSLSISAQPAAQTAVQPYTQPDVGDYSSLSWTEAFAKAHAQFSREYAFTEWKGIDWARLGRVYTAKVETAARAEDREAWIIAIREYLHEIPDAHIAFYAEDDVLMRRSLGGSFGLGLAMDKDGRMIVAGIRAGGAAAKAGVQVGAEILGWNGLFPQDALARADTRWFAIAATTESLGLKQLKALNRAPVGALARLRFMAPGQAVASADLVAEADDMADLGLAEFAYSPPIAKIADAISWRLLDAETGYINISILADMEALDKYPHAMLEKVGEILGEMMRKGVDRLVLDIRGNHGGYDQLAADLAGFFTDREAFYERIFQYDGRTGKMELIHNDEESGNSSLEDYAMQVRPQAPHFAGKVAVLVNPATVSSGEGLAMAISRLPGTAVIGFHGTAGAFGMVGNAIVLPGDIAFSYPHGQSLDRDGRVQLDSAPVAGPGSIVWKGGVEPSIRVPLTAENLIAHAGGRDIELEHALQWLAEGK
jgi:carboxyl-terminal processing protease